MRIAIAALSIALVAGASCIDSSAPKEFVCTRDDSLVFNVGPGLTPTISWTPECTAFLLGVVDSGPLEQVEFFWFVAPRDSVSSQVPPPVIYGTPPPNAMQPFPAVPLVVGRAYGLFVTDRQGDLVRGAPAYFRR